MKKLIMTVEITMSEDAFNHTEVQEMIKGFQEDVQEAFMESNNTVKFEKAEGILKVERHSSCLVIT